MRSNEIKVKVTTDLSATITRLIARGVILEDLQRDVTSKDAAFHGVLATVLQGAHNIGREEKDVKAATEKARKARKRGIVVKWRTAAMKAEREKQLTIWQSRKFANDAEALAGLCDELANTSVATVRRIFHPHTRVPKGKRK